MDSDDEEIRPAGSNFKQTFRDEDGDTSSVGETASSVKDIHESPVQGPSRSKRSSKRLASKKTDKFELLKSSRKKRILQRFEDSSESDEENTDENESNINEDSSEDNAKFKRKTRVFKSHYRSLCDLPTCHRRFIPNKTDILGVHLRCGPHPWYDFKGKDNGKNYHICAAHLHDGSDRSEDEEGNSDDENFIDDSDAKSDDNVIEYEDNSDSVQFEDILADLNRSTNNDVQNQKKYNKEQSKYQLEIHSLSNPALYLDPDVRERRYYRAAYRDMGMKDPIDKSNVSSSNEETDDQPPTNNSDEDNSNCSPESSQSFDAHDRDMTKRTQHVSSSDDETVDVVTDDNDGPGIARPSRKLAKQTKINSYFKVVKSATTQKFENRREMT